MSHLTNNAPAGSPGIRDARLRFARVLYVRHSGELLSFFRATRRMSKSEAADLVHQTFCELLETLAKHEELEVHRPRPFLFKLATRQFCAAYRRKLRQPVVDDETAVVDIASRDLMDDLEYRASLRAEQRLVLRAMRKLTDDVAVADAEAEPSSSEAGEISQLQLIVYFRFWVGLTLAEVAEILDVTPGVVSSRQRRALQLLRRYVEQIEATEDAPASTSTTLLQRWRDGLEREAKTRSMPRGWSGSPPADPTRIAGGWSAPR